MRRLIQHNLLQFAILLVCALMLFATTSMASTINVGPGQTYTTIQAGINAANNGDTVLVAPGTYNENINFNGKAITVTSSGGAAVTVIDGGSTNAAVTFSTSETRNSILSGFTIQHGGSYTNPSIAAVGGIYLQDSAPTILNNILTQNNCWTIESYASAPLIQNNEINSTQDPKGYCSFGGGAGIYIQNNLNDSSSTGSTVSPVIIGNTIENNVESGLEDAGGNGGAAIAVWGGSPIIFNNIMRNNASPGGSGGAINVQYGNNVVVVQNLIYGNSAGCGGGALAVQTYSSTGYSSFIANNTIVNNITDAELMGDSECAFISQIYPWPDAYGSSSPSIEFINNIIDGDTAYPAVNCGWYGTPSLSTQPTFEYNILLNSGGPFFGSYCIDVSATDNNITLDPQFVSVTSNNYHLQSTSPAIDSGQNSVLQTFNTMTGLTWSTDFDGNPRMQDAGKGCIIDMGAYEYTGSVTDCSTATTESLSSSLNPSLVNQSVIFTAQLSAAAGTPTGDVEFLDGITLLSTQTVSTSGSASYSTNALNIGSHNITANYEPTGAFSASTASLTQVVNPATLITPTWSWYPLTPITYPTPLSAAQFNANVLNASTNINADGTFNYFVGPVSGGIIATTSTVLPVGSDQLCVQWIPTSAYASTYNSISACATIVVNPAATTVSATGANANFGNVPVNSTSAVTPVTFSFTGSGTIGAPTVLTQGIAGLDYINVVADPGTCITNGTTHVYNIGDTCTVNVTLTPSHPGIRYGAVDLFDNSGNLLTTAYLQGIGTGPQAIFADTTTGDYIPASDTTLDTGFGALESIALDGEGNIFLADQSIQQVQEILAAGGYITVKQLGGSYENPSGVAVDGAGNLFVADQGSNIVYELSPVDGYTSSKSIGSGFVGPYGIVVDAIGNLFVSNVVNNTVIELTAASGYTTVTTLGSGFNEPTGLALDANDNLFVADNANNAVKELLASSGYTTINTLGSGFSGPIGLAVDAAGNVYVANGGAGLTQVILASSGYTTVITLGNGQTYPYDIALDGAGNLFIADGYQGLVSKLNFSTPPTLTFASTPVGQTSTDSPQTVTLINDGNTSLTFPKPASGDNPSITTNFNWNSASSGDCTLLTPASASASTLAPGTSCNLPTSFKPTVSGSITGQLTLTNNNLNLANSTQIIPLNGTATGGSLITPTLSWNPATPITYPTPLSSAQFNANVLNASTNINTDGTFTYYVGPVSGGIIATTSTILPVGSDQLCVQWLPTSSYTSTYNSVSGCSTIQVLPTSGPQATNTTISSNLNPAFIQNPIIFTAIVTSASGTPTGTVDFYDSATLIGSSILTNGQATLTTSALTIGAHSIVARFVANSSYLASTSGFISEFLDDFSLVNNSQSTLVVPPLTATSMTFTITPLGPASNTPQPVIISISGIPSGIQYSLNPTTIPAGQPTTELGLSINSPIQASLRPTPNTPSQSRQATRIAPLLLSLLLLPVTAIFRRTRKRLTKLTLLSILTLTAAMGLTSCGSVLNSITSAVTVTATSGALTHSTTFTLKIE